MSLSRHPLSLREIAALGRGVWFDPSYDAVQIAVARHRQLEPETLDETVYGIVRDAPVLWQMVHRDDPSFSIAFHRLRFADRHGYHEWLWEIEGLERMDGYVWPDGRVTTWHEGVMSR